MYCHLRKYMCCLEFRSGNYVYIKEIRVSSLIQCAMCHLRDYALPFEEVPMLSRLQKWQLFLYQRNTCFCLLIKCATAFSTSNKHKCHTTFCKKTASYLRAHLCLHQVRTSDSNFFETLRRDVFKPLPATAGGSCS